MFQLIKINLNHITIVILHQQGFTYTLYALGTSTPLFMYLTKISIISAHHMQSNLYKKQR